MWYTFGLISQKKKEKKIWLKYDYLNYSNLQSGPNGWQLC